MSGTAINGSDYTAIYSPITIAAGSSYRDIALTPINNNVWEPNETAILTISTNSAYLRGSPYNATITIADDESPNIITNPTFNPNYGSSSSPTVLKAGGWVTVNFNYSTNQLYGVLVLAVPYTDGSPTPGASSPASALLPAVLPPSSGKGSCRFTVNGSSEGEVISVDHIQIRMYPYGGNTLLRIFDVYGYYEFREPIY